MSFLSDEILRPSREPYPEYTQAIDLYYRKVLRRPPPFDMSREEVDSSGFWQSQEFIDETMRGVPGFNYRRFEEPRDAGRGFVPMDVMMRQAEASVKKWLAERAEQERRNPAVTPAAIPLAGPTANTAASQAASPPLYRPLSASAEQNVNAAAKPGVNTPSKQTAGAPSSQAATAFTGQGGGPIANLIAIAEGGRGTNTAAPHAVAQPVSQVVPPEAGQEPNPQNKQTAEPTPLDHFLANARQTISRSVAARAKDNSTDAREIYSTYNNMPREAFKGLSQPLREHLLGAHSRPMADAGMRAEFESALGRRVFYNSREEFEASEHWRPGVTWYPGMTIAGAANIAKGLDEELERLGLIRQANENGGWTYKLIGLAGGLAGGLVDPLNLIPGAAGAKAAGAGMSVGRAALTGAKAALPSALGASAFSNASEYSDLNQKGREISKTDAALGTVTGTALGAGLGALGGALKPLADNIAKRLGLGEIRGAKGAEAATSFDPRGPLYFDENKWNYLFGRATGNKHNLDRTAQLRGIMGKLGILEIPEHQKMLLDHLDEVAKNYPTVPSTNKNSNIQIVKKESIFTGPSGITVKFESFFQLLDDGTLRFVTLIPKELKHHYKN